MRVEKNQYLLAMVLIILLAFALGAHGLNLDPIWADELSSVTHFGAFDPPYSPEQVLRSIRQYSPDHVPLYFVVGSVWAQVAGWSQFSLRLMSLLFAALMLSWLYRFASDLVNQRTAIVVALLMTSSAFVILYYHDMRAYTMLMSLAIMHTWLYWRLSNGARVTRLTWILFVVTTGLLFYTQNVATILFIGLGVHHLLFVEKTRRWLHIMIGWGLGVLSFLPYVPKVVAGLGFNQSVTNNPLSTAEVAKLFEYLVVNGLEVLWIPLLFCFGFALWRHRNPTIFRLLFVLGLMVTVILLVNWRFNIITNNRMRYFLVAWFVIVTLFAYGITSMPYWRVTTGAIVLIWCAAGFQFYRTDEVVEFAGLMARDRRYPPLHEYIFHLQGKTMPHDFLLGFTADDRVSRVSSNKSNSTSDYYLKVQLDIDGIFLHSNLKRYRLESDVREILHEHPHLLLAHDPAEVPLNYARTLSIIQENYVPCAVLVDNPELLIQRYVQHDLGCDHMRAQIEYENGIEIVDHAAGYDSGTDRIRVLIWWNVPEEKMLEAYNISLQILTSDWQNVRQLDRHLYDDQVPWNVTELSTEGLPEGDYTLVLILYDRESGDKVIGLAEHSGSQANVLPLLSFTKET